MGNQNLKFSLYCNFNFLVLLCFHRSWFAVWTLSENVHTLCALSVRATAGFLTRTKRSWTSKPALRSCWTPSLMPPWRMSGWNGAVKPIAASHSLTKCLGWVWLNTRWSQANIFMSNYNREIKPIIYSDSTRLSDWQTSMQPRLLLPPRWALCCRTCPERGRKKAVSSWKRRGGKN